MISLTQHVNLTRGQENAFSRQTRLNDRLQTDPEKNSLKNLVTENSATSNKHEIKATSYVVPVDRVELQSTRPVDSIVDIYPKDLSNTVYQQEATPSTAPKLDLEPKPTLSPTTTLTPTPSTDYLVVGSGAKVDISSKIGIDNASDTLIIDNGARSSLNSEVGIDNGNDFTYIGSGAKVDISAKVGVDNSHDILLVGSGAKLKMDVEIGTSRGSGLTIIEDGADVVISGKLGLSESSGITYLRGRVRIHLEDDSGKEFAIDMKTDQREDFESFIDSLRERLSSMGRLSLKDLRKEVNQFEQDFKKHSVQYSPAESELPIKNNTSKTYSKKQYLIDTQLMLMSKVLGSYRTNSSSLNPRDPGQVNHLDFRN